MVDTPSGPCGVLAVLAVEPVHRFAVKSARALPLEKEEWIAKEISQKFEHVERSTAPLVRTFIKF